GGQAVGGAFHRARLDDKTAFFPGLVGDLGFIEGLAGGEGEDPSAGQGLVQGEDPLGQAVGDVEGEAQLGQAEDGGELQAPGGDAGALHLEGQVCFAAVQGAPDVGAVGAVLDQGRKLHAQLGGHGKQLVAKGGQGGVLAGQKQVQVGRAGVLLDGDALLDGALVQAQDLLGLGVKAPPGRRQGHLAGAVLEKGEVQLVFQGADLLGQGGLGDKQGVCRCGKTAQLHHFDKAGQ